MTDTEMVYICEEEVAFLKKVVFDRTSKKPSAFRGGLVRSIGVRVYLVAAVSHAIDEALGERKRISK